MNDKMFVSTKAQLDDIKNQWNAMLARSEYEDASDLPEGEVILLITQ